MKMIKKRRRTKNSNTDKWIAYLFVSAIAFSYAAESGYFFHILMIGGFFAIILYMVATLDRSILNKRLENLVRDHIDTLAHKRRQTIFIDEYGKEDRSDWDKEIARFHDRVIVKDLKNIPDSVDSLAKTTEIVDRLTSSRAKRLRMLAADVEDGIAFEVRCAQTLRANGWAAYPTKASGDQGADVIAERNGVRVVFQCKRYRGSVGNKAVQEASAAMVHYAADIAAVVTTGSYTKGARQLAKTTGVQLLHEGDLPTLSDQVSVLLTDCEVRKPGGV